MNKKILTIILILIFKILMPDLSISYALTSEEKRLYKDLDNLVGRDYFFLSQKWNTGKFTITIIKHFTIEDDKVKIIEYPKGFEDFIKKHIREHYNPKYEIQMAPNIPPNIIGEYKKKRSLKTMLLASLISLFLLLFGVIMFRAVQKEIARKKNKDNPI